MWLFTTTGFYSIVSAGGDRLLVRSRVREDLDRLRGIYLPGLSPTEATPARDYPYRARASQRSVANALGRIARDIVYDNFKEAAAARHPQREAVYGAIWSELRSLEVRRKGRPSR